jgi:hypothetical protein
MELAGIIVSKTLLVKNIWVTKKPGYLFGNPAFSSGDPRLSVPPSRMVWLYRKRLLEDLTEIYIEIKSFVKNYFRALSEFVIELREYSRVFVEMPYPVRRRRAFGHYAPADSVEKNLGLVLESSYKFDEICPYF